MTGQPYNHPAAIDPDQLLRSCDARTGRVRGPGGQNRNKLETAVTLLHQPTGVEARASERRSQVENRRVALFRLRVNLALQVRRDFPLRDGPSALWRSRSHAGKLPINPAHADFPALLAEALDALEALRHDPSAAADVLGCTASQLLKLLRHEPRALAQLNAARATRGKHALK